jgi:hypothetical protein
VYAETIALYDAQGQPCRLLELGIFRGESLAVWTEFLNPNSVTGVDGNVAPFAASLTKLLSRGAFREGVPMVLQGLAADPAIAAKVANSSLDLIVDDAGHFRDQQLQVFKVWSCKVASRGSYVIEDVRGQRSEAKLVLALRAAAPAAAICTQGNLILLRWERPLPAECQPAQPKDRQLDVLTQARAMRWKV